MNYLDEIEMELKGAESMEYKCGFWPSTFGAGVLCGRVILCPMIPRSTCPHRGPIPVEPERVAGISGRCAAPANSECSHAGPSDQFCKYCTYWKPAEPERVSAVECSRANARCPVGRQYFEAGGKHFCHSRTSPCPHTWAQRMGMATWPSEARDWFCISQFWPSAHSMTETEAKEMCRGESLRAFRWSQGVQG